MDETNVNVICAPADNNIKINKWRVREGFPVNNSQVVLLYEICNDENKTVQRLKSNKVGVVRKRLYDDGAIVEKGFPLLELSECIHTTVIKDMCADCGADLRQNENGNTSNASVPMIHSVPDLKVSQKLAQKLGHADTKRLLEDKKLVLLVDLDQTIIHTTNDNVPSNVKNIYHFQLYGSNSPWYHTRMRPGTAEFLKNISDFFELHICTFGARNYAHTIAQLLDPRGKFFSHRILSRDECFNATSKTDNLKALFPNGDTMVCIIDDREDVWNMASNLIQVKPYHFFQHTGDINAPPGLSKNDLDGKGMDFKNIDAVAKSADSSDKDEKTDDTESKQDSNNDKSDDEIGDDLEEKTDSITTEDDETEKTSTEDENNVAEKINNVSEDKDPSTSVKSKTDEVPENDSSTKNEQKLIEIDDPDDYLLYLEDILKRIHVRFYEIYEETKEICDLKTLIPEIRSKVLNGVNIVFSGLVPTNMKLEQSRAYLIAKSLGANVSQNINAETTHMVAATAGTFKVNAARKRNEIKIVNANWLWSCAERWEHVNEVLFPLDKLKDKNKQRQPPAHCHSPEYVINYSEKAELASRNVESEKSSFLNTINPLLSFTNADLAEMNQEFDQFFESDSSSDDEHVNIENPPIEKTLRKRKRQEKDEERQYEFFSREEQQSFIIENPKGDKKEEGCLDDDDDNDEGPSSAKILREEEEEGEEEDEEDIESENEVLSDDSAGSASSDKDEGDDGDWNMMGAALEREFLGLD